MKDRGPNIWLTKSGRSPFWVIRYQDPETGRTMQKSTGTEKKQEAERFLGEFRSDLLNARYHGQKIYSWKEFRERYDAEILSGFARATVKKADTVLDAVEDILNPVKLKDVSASRISKFIADLRKGRRSESTIAGYLAHLRAALNWAVGVGMLQKVPHIQKPKRSKVYKKSKGRAPTEKEFRTVLAMVPEIVGQERADSWQYLLEGLWWSGLRLGEALELWWDRQDKLCIDLTQGRPLLRIPAELEKGHQDRFLPIAPEFAEFLLRTPPELRTGLVFMPKAERKRGEKLSITQVTKIISAIGRKAEILVHVDPKTEKEKYVSAHDFRRAFGDRWALRVMPPVLMQLMRHESIDTTMRYYVGRSVQATADVVWEAYGKTGPKSENLAERDTLRDTNQITLHRPEEERDAS